MMKGGCNGVFHFFFNLKARERVFIYPLQAQVWTKKWLANQPI